jgi:hypothetical protein
LLALTGMTSFTPVDFFDEYTPIPPKLTTGEEPTQLTIRVEGLPSRWRAWRRWAGLLLAIAAAAVAGKLIDSRRSSTRQYPRDPESKAAIPTPARHAKRQPQLPKTPSSAAAPPRRKPTPHRPRIKLGRRASAPPRLSPERAVTRPPIDVTPEHPQPSISAPPTTPKTPPSSAPQAGSSQPDSRPPAGEEGNEQFAYLGR